MPNTAPVQVPITVDNATAAGIQSAVGSLKQFETAGTAAGQRTSAAFHESRGSVDLLSNAIGIRLNRELKGVVAAADLLGPVLEVAFPVAAAIGFAQVLFDIGKRMYDFANGTKEAAEQAKTLSESLSKMANVRGQILGQATQARAEGALIGLTGEDRSNEEIRQLNELLLENQARVRQTKNDIFGLQNGLLDVGNGFATAKDEIASLNGTLGELQAREQLLEQQLSNKTSDAFVEQMKAREEAAKKLAEQLEKTFDIVEKGVTQFPVGLLSGNARATGGLPAESVSRPPIGSLSDFGIKSPLFPLFATKEELDIAKQYGFVLTGITEQTNRLGSAQKNLDDAITRGFDNAFQDIALGTRGVGQAFESLAASVAASVLQMVAKLTILPPLLSAINAALSAVGLTGLPAGTVISHPGPNGSIPLFGGAGAISLASAVPRASGGPVMPGSLYLVGEHGPEYLRTGSSGFISPIGGGSPRVTIINQSSQPVSAKATTRFDVEGAVTTVVLKDLNQNGPIRQALGGR